MPQIINLRIEKFKRGLDIDLLSSLVFIRVISKIVHKMYK